MSLPARVQPVMPASRALYEGAAVADDAVCRVAARVLTRCRDHPQLLEEVLYEAIYREEQRLARPTPRAENDRAFIRGLRHELARVGAEERPRLLRSLLSRYGTEIGGRFDRHVYRFATSVLPASLGALLHGGRVGPRLFDVDDRVLLEGDVQGLRNAARNGTVALVPTHFSHLDSLLLGYAIFRLGLPPFAYGAGLNLFTSSLTGFFMRNLGAFTVDREKSDPLYRGLVKEYATVLLEQGQHLLFFPGGTRSRSGGVESRLKRGFLGTAVTAFGNGRARDPRSRPMFIVPCTLSYPLVLEASSLVDQYLSSEGGPHFVDVRDEFEQPSSWLGFLGGLAELDLKVHVRFGAPLDPFGNRVDGDGRSLDPSGRVVDPERYLRVDGVLARDEVRDGEYTNLLAERVLGANRAETVALPSSVLAFCLFACLRRRHREFDVFRFLRMLGTHSSVALAELEPQIDLVLPVLRELAVRAQLVLDPELERDGRSAVLGKGVATLSVYHRPAVLRQRGQSIEVTSPNLLLYYKTRLDGFGLPHEHSGTGRSVAPETWRTP